MNLARGVVSLGEASLIGEDHQPEIDTAPRLPREGEAVRPYSRWSDRAR